MEVPRGGEPTWKKGKAMMAVVVRDNKNGFPLIVAQAVSANSAEEA